MGNNQQGGQLEVKAMNGENHTLKATLPTPKTKPTCYIYWDAETNGLSATKADFLFLKAVLCIEGKPDEWKQFDDIQSFKDWLAEIGETYGETHDCRSYAHNGWNFDYLIMHTALEIKNLDKIQRKGRILSADFHGVQLCDSSNLLPTSISKLGDSLGMPKGTTPVQMMNATVFKKHKGCKTYADIKEKHPKTAKQWEHYCYLDVKILKAAVETTQRLYNNSNGGIPYRLPLTAASMAYRTWCNNYFPNSWTWERPVKATAKQGQRPLIHQINSLTLTDVVGELEVWNKTDRQYETHELKADKITEFGEMSGKKWGKGHGEQINIGKHFGWGQHTDEQKKKTYPLTIGFFKTVLYDFAIGEFQVKRAELVVNLNKKTAILKDAKIVGVGKKHHIMCKAVFDSKLLMEQVQSVSCPFEANKSAEYGYYGGMVYLNPKYAGKLVHDVRSWDRNSQFPAEMLIHEFPDMNKVMRKKATVSNVMSLRERGVGYWGHFTLSPPTEEQITQNGWDKVWFPVKKGRGALTYVHNAEVSGYYVAPLVNYALDNGWTMTHAGTDEDKWVWFAHEMIKPFDDYVEHFYGERLKAQKEGRDADQLVIKIGYLNSLYGRFGMKATKRFLESDNEIATMIAEETEEAFDFESIMGDRSNVADGQLPVFDAFWNKWNVNFYVGKETAYAYFEEKEATELADSCWFGFAAFITANANVSLMKAINSLGDRFIYSDTDSVHAVDADSFVPALDIGDEIGKWKPEQETTIPKATYWEAKAYTWRNADGTPFKVKHKGVPDSNGELTEPQSAKGVRKPKQALRQQKTVGETITVVKHSSRYCSCSKCLTKKFKRNLKGYMKLRESLIVGVVA